MAELLDRPFLTEDFSPDGAGIDFLGLRWANLRILDEYLLPGVNNATEDFGVYCLAAWLPWKFKSLCKDPKQFRLAQFTRFRQAVEVAMAFVSRTESPATLRLGAVHRQIGARQKLTLPSRLNFDRAGRTEATSIYAAPLYGPSVRYLGLAGRALAEDGSVTDIWATAEDSNTMAVVTAVEDALSVARSAGKMDDMADLKFTAKQLDEMGCHGLHPAYSRRFPKKVKQAFLTKLLPTEAPNGRTLTARLVIRTLRARRGLDVDSLRHVWHSALLGENRPHQLSEPELAAHRDRWRMLMIRQYQRYVLEEFLRCFEVAVLAGSRTLDEITDHVLRDTLRSGKRTSTVRELFNEEAAPVSHARDYAVVAARWASVVHPGHPAYIEAIALGEDQNGGCGPALRMLVRWWFGSMQAVLAEGNKELAALGGEDRISIRWFHRWVEARLDSDLTTFVRDIFEQLIFAQHVRVALSRFDGGGQRLRFVLGDDGIVPTRSMVAKLATGLPGWMADRLTAFVNLLCDLSVLQSNEDGRLEEGPLAEAVVAP